MISKTELSVHPITGGEMDDERLERLDELMWVCHIFVASLKADLDLGLKTTIEVRTREFELKAHQCIAEARQRYERGLQRAESLPDAIRAIEVKRLEKGLDRTIDGFLDQLSDFKDAMEAIINS